MLLNLASLLGGGVLLYFGAEWLVGGAAGLARLAGVRPLVVGLTVVAWGTSAPEVVVSVMAALEGSPAIALGNVVGSNVANLGLILGVTSLVLPPKVDGKLIRREIPVLVVATLLIPLLLWNDRLSRREGLLLTCGAVAFSAWLALGASRSRARDVPVSETLPESVPGPRSPVKLALLVVFGLAVLVSGGRLFVQGATAMAHAFGISERVVGLTVVAIGTSLPEMATSLVAAFRGHSDIAVGNVVGSNIFNALLVLGIAATIEPMSYPIASMWVDVAVMLGLTAFAAVMMRTERRLTRAEGGLLVASYAAFLVAAVLEG